VRARAVPRSIDRLVREGWLTAGETPRPASSFSRRFVASAAPPARSAEVHRFVAEQIPASDRMAETAERALHLVLGGREAEGVRDLLRAAEAFVASGYATAGAQLAMIVLGLEVPDADRTRAESIARAFPRHRALATTDLAAGTDAPSVEMAIPLEALPASIPPPRPEEPRTETVAIDDAAEADAPDEETELHRELRDAIRRRDFEALDGLAERAIAIGSDMQAVARIRALAAALRGDLAGAQQRLDRMRQSEAPRDRRALLAEAMVALRAGRSGSAVRLALRALADSRRANDERGEAVALFTMAACFRAAGRPNDAALLEARVDA
jgi:hypothetical protein